jgi:hypothetical protein
MAGQVRGTSVESLARVSRGSIIPTTIYQVLVYVSVFARLMHMLFAIVFVWQTGCAGS